MKLIMQWRAGWAQEEESVKNWKDVLSWHAASLPPFDYNILNDKQLLVESNLPSLNTYSDQVRIFGQCHAQQVWLNFYQGNPLQY
jgi:hypothetical protein